MASGRKDGPRLEEALRRKAFGYEAVEVKEIEEEDDSGKRKMKKERTVKSVPPDLEAMRMLMALEEGGGPTITVVSAAPRPQGAAKAKKPAAKKATAKKPAAKRAAGGKA